MDKLKNVIDHDEIVKFFPQIFSALSHTADSKYVFLCNIETDFSYWSPEAIEYFGLSKEFGYKIEEEWVEHIAEDERQYFVDNIGALFRGEIDDHDMIYRARNREGHYVTCTCKGKLIRDENGKPAFFAGIIINHEKEFVIDHVTGLYIRNALFDAMRSLLDNHTPFYLLATGIRQFSEINLNYGYAFGNKVLKTMAEYALGRRNGAYIYRCDGVKTVTLLLAKDHPIKRIVERYDFLKTYYEYFLEVDGVQVPIEICGGLLYVDAQDTLDVSTIYNSAMQVIHEAKHNGSPKLNIVNNDMLHGNARHLTVLNEIRKSVINHCEGFFLCYQPIVDAKTEAVTGMEALIRWKNDEFGTIPPGVFISWLEQDNLFFKLGNWIIEQAITDTQPILSDHPDFVVNINLAYPQLQRSNFKLVFKQIVEERNFPTRNIKIELTERCKLLNMNKLRKDMNYFKKEGMYIALDDFGTGYSAMNLISELPVDQIKVDRSFIVDIQTDAAKQSLLRAITNCAKDLGKDVCVEGIETEEMACYLRDNFPVSFFQGYYYGKPMTIDKFRTWMKDWEETLN